MFHTGKRNPTSTSTWQKLREKETHSVMGNGRQNMKLKIFWIAKNHSQLHTFLTVCFTLCPQLLDKLQWYSHLTCITENNRSSSQWADYSYSQNFSPSNSACPMKQWNCLWQVLCNTRQSIVWNTSSHIEEKEVDSPSRWQGSLAVEHSF